MDLAFRAGLGAGIPSAELKDAVASAGFDGLATQSEPGLKESHLEASAAEATRRLVRALGSESERDTTPAAPVPRVRRLLREARSIVAKAGRDRHL